MTTSKSEIPDEFDYTLLVPLLSLPRVCKLEATDEAGFVNVLIVDAKQRDVGGSPQSSVFHALNTGL